MAGARIVLTCWGSYGDLFPALGLARTLKQRGHEPVLATCAFYRPLVEAEGVEFHPVRPDIDPSDTALIARLMDPARGTEVIVRELLVPAVRDAYADLEPVARHADLILSHPVTFATPIVAERLQRRWMSMVLAPASFFSRYDLPVLPPFTTLAAALGRTRWSAEVFLRVAKAVTRGWLEPVRALRRDVGLPAGGDPLYEGQFSPHGTLALFSRTLGKPQPDWPVRAVQPGFVFYQPAAGPADDVDRFLAGGEPPIVFTLGSSAAGAPGTFYEESVLAARLVGRRALLLVRDDLAAPALSDSDVLETSFVPHDQVFPYAAAIVHHGGVGTTGQALSAGRPMLVVPHAHDQPDNAARVRRLGVGRTLPAARYRARAAARHLRPLLSDARYTRAAADAARVVASEPGADGAAESIERLLAESPS